MNRTKVSLVKKATADHNCLILNVNGTHKMSIVRLQGSFSEYGFLLLKY